MSLKERGVAVLLAAENAETIEPTAKIEITNILAEMVPSLQRFRVYFGN
jgi:hypothetical protein